MQSSSLRMINDEEKPTTLTNTKSGAQKLTGLGHQRHGPSRKLGFGRFQGLVARLIKVLNHGTPSRILQEANLAMKIKWEGNYGSRLDAMARWKA
jgi:hypothetical protein